MFLFPGKSMNLDSLSVKYLLYMLYVYKSTSTCNNIDKMHRNVGKHFSSCGWNYICYILLYLYRFCKFRFMLYICRHFPKAL